MNISKVITGVTEKVSKNSSSNVAKELFNISAKKLAKKPDDIMKAMDIESMASKFALSTKKLKGKIVDTIGYSPNHSFTKIAKEGVVNTLKSSPNLSTAKTLAEEGVVNTLTLSPYLSTAKTLAKEGVISGGLDAKSAVNGAKATMNATKLNNKIKSARESAKVFIQNGKTKSEIKAAQEELKANLNKKYGEKIKARQLAKIKQEYTQRELDKLNKLL